MRIKVEKNIYRRKQKVDTSHTEGLWQKEVQGSLKSLLKLSQFVVTEFFTGHSILKEHLHKHGIVNDAI